MGLCRRHASWGRGLGLLVALACLVVIAAPASATQLPATDDPLAGSTFQGGDGDQDDPDGAGELVDWQSLDGVVHRSDANAADTEFAGGSEDNNPGDWGLDTRSGGVSPAADNIRDLWAAIDQPAGDTFVHLAFSRQSASGATTYLAFELNRDGRLWNNGKAEIPCRRTNDLAITYEIHGNVPRVRVKRWVTDNADEGTGCARSGRFADPVDVEANVNAQGQLNGTAIDGHLGGAFSPRVPAQQFGEASLNLSDIAEKVFGDRCLAYSSVWMHSRASLSEHSALKDFVEPERLPVRSCTASGTKFWDGNANGVRDPGEPGLKRWKIWADYDGNGRHDRSEPFSITDKDGEYVIHDIQGEYTLRETLLAPRRSSIPLDWVCSHPTDDTEGGTGSAQPGRFPCAWGPFNVAETPNVENRDFGNWFPAQLTLEKFVFPPSDPGSWDLLVGPAGAEGTVELAGAGNGSSRTIGLPPGTYDVSERPAAGTDPADYLTPVVDCQSHVSRPGKRRSGTVFEGLELVAGARATCTFTNVRRGEPAIAIRKSGPAVATAGDKLRYTLVVTNPGAVPIPAETVEVSDPACAPRLVEKRSDSGVDDTPGTLDPSVDEWEYSCSRKTAKPGPDCETRTVDNTATVTGLAEGRTVTASDSISTILGCPDEPRPVPPLPDEPGPIDPPGPEPPDAGEAGRARLLLRQGRRRCLTERVQRVNVRGTRIAQVSVIVNGQLRRRIAMEPLQRGVAPRVSLPPGRNRVEVRVLFELGAATLPVTLSRNATVCTPRRAGPQFTG